MRADHRSDPVKAQSHFLSLATVVQNEARWLPEWLEYHALQGCDHFLLYDDGSTDSIHAVVIDYPKAGSSNFSRHRMRTTN